MSQKTLRKSEAVIGRPRKKDSERAKERVGCRATETEKDIWEICAKADDTNLAAWLKKVANQASRSKKYQDALKNR